MMALPTCLPSSTVHRINISSPLTLQNGKRKQEGGGVVRGGEEREGMTERERERERERGGERERERERWGGGGGAETERDRGRDRVCLFVGCLTSQQHASVSQGRICSDNFTCCHTEIEAADPTFHLTLSQHTDTGPTSPSADPITPGAWQSSHWSANF